MRPPSDGGLKSCTLNSTRNATKLLNISAINHRLLFSSLHYFYKNTITSNQKHHTWYFDCKSLQVIIQNQKHQSIKDLQKYYLKKSFSSKKVVGIFICCMYVSRGPRPAV